MSDALREAYIRTDRILRTMTSGTYRMVACACCGKPESAAQVSDWEVDTMCDECFFGNPSCLRCVNAGIRANEFDKTTWDGLCHKVGVVHPVIEDWTRPQPEDIIYMVCGKTIEFANLGGADPEVLEALNWCPTCWPEKIGKQ